MATVTDEDLRRALSLDMVAVVGCSATPGKDAHQVPVYLVEHGYTVIPVNPNREVVLDRPAADSLAAVDERVDLVNVFRPSDEVGEIVDAALARDDVQTVWTQLDIRDESAASRAARAGLSVIQDRCIMVEHRRLCR